MATTPPYQRDAEINNEMDESQPTTPAKVLSPLNNRSGSTSSRKRPLENTQSPCEENGVSPVKGPRKENSCDNNNRKKADLDIFQRGPEKRKDYRRKLREKLVTCGQNLGLLRRLQNKDKLITNLELRIAQLENKQGITSDHDSNTSDDGSSVRENLKINNSESPTQKLIHHIRKLEEENEHLRTQISSLEVTEMKFKKGFGRWSLNIDSKSHVQFCHSEQRIKELEFQVAQKEKKIQSLQSDKESIRKQLHVTEVKHRQAEKLLQKQISELEKQINELQVKLLQAEIECMDEQAKFLEHLANIPSMIVVESKTPAVHNTKAIQCVQDDVQTLKMSHAILKKQVCQVPKLWTAMVRETSEKIQEAIQATDEKNKELVHRYTREIQLRKCYHNQLVELRGNIRVFCRVRPCIKEDGHTETVMDFDAFDDGVILVSNKGRNQQFHLDKVFSTDVSQSQIFEEVSSLVRSAIDGFNVCIFAYGQTGSGKTYTMEGPSDDPGVNQRALQLLYEETKNSSWQYEIEASMLEIYNETLRDLLNADPNTNKLEVKMKPEGGLHVPGLVTIPVKSLHEVNKIFEAGRQNRATAATSMNERSSRSHCLLCVTVSGVNTITGSRTYGRLNLVDLAGSERVSKSQADGARLKEAQSINKSLSSLGDVISALKNKQPHIPYRNSKLTYLLQDSLGGDSKTLMILQVSPVEKNASESICTLTFGQRVRSAELGAATRRLEEGNKCTPSSARRPNADTPMPKSPTNVTPSKRTPNLPKASTVPAKLNLRFK